MWRVIFGVALGLMLMGCSKSANDKSSAANDAKVPPLTAKSDKSVPPLSDFADAKGSITGVAVDAEGKGVEEVTVSIHCGDRGEPIATVTTAANGKFTVEKVPVAGDYVVKIVNKKSVFARTAKISMSQCRPARRPTLAISN